MNNKLAVKDNPRLIVIQKLYGHHLNKDSEIYFPKHRYKKFIKDVVNGTIERKDLIQDLINKELKNANLPDEIRVGAVLRKNEIIIPRSNFIFKKEDVVVILSKRDQLPLVESMFRLSPV